MRSCRQPGQDGKAGQPTHVYVVNLDYRDPVKTTVVGPKALSVFNATTKKWTPSGKTKITMIIGPGDGVLVKLTQ